MKIQRNDRMERHQSIYLCGEKDRKNLASKGNSVERAKEDC